MKVIIAGSRHLDNASVVAAAIMHSGFDITQVVSGGASGVDASGEALADLHSMDLKVFPADWKRHGKAAGPIRNKQMAAYADALIAVWDGQSRGTKNMIDEMKKLNKPVFVYRFEEQNEEA